MWPFGRVFSFFMTTPNLVPSPGSLFLFSLSSSRQKCQTFLAGRRETLGTRLDHTLHMHQSVSHVVRGRKARFIRRICSMTELNRTQSFDWVRLRSIKFDFRTFDVIRRVFCISIKKTSLRRRRTWLKKDWRKKYKYLAMSFQYRFSITAACM